MGHPDYLVQEWICIFVDGEYVHADPTVYDAGTLIYGRTAMEVWERDARVTAQLTLQGYTVIRFWSKQIRNNIRECVEEIKRHISLNTQTANNVQE